MPCLTQPNWRAFRCDAYNIQRARIIGLHVGIQRQGPSCSQPSYSQPARKVRTVLIHEVHLAARLAQDADDASIPCRRSEVQSAAPPPPPPTALRQQGMQAVVVQEAVPG